MGAATAVAAKEAERTEAEEASVEAASTGRAGVETGEVAMAVAEELA